MTAAGVEQVTVSRRRCPALITLLEVSSLPVWTHGLHLKPLAVDGWSAADHKQMLVALDCWVILQPFPTPNGPFFRILPFLHGHVFSCKTISTRQWGDESGQFPRFPAHLSTSGFESSSRWRVSSAKPTAEGRRCATIMDHDQFCWCCSRPWITPHTCK